jgi:hypothetical protein
MRTNWLIAIAAGAAIGASAPTELLAQGNSNRARQQQQQQRQDAREQERRQAERAQLQRQREQQRLQAERAQLQRQREQQRRQQATQVRIRRDDDRYRRNDRDRRYDNRWDDRRYDSRYDDRYDRRGPAFCRSGEGHPVFGRQWCRDKGFGLGRERSRDIWGDIIYRDRDRRSDDRRLDRRTLGDILGSVVLGRFDQYGRTYYGGQGDIGGRWLDGRSVMQLYMGGIPFARLIDRDRDGRVDDVILAR